MGEQVPVHPCKGEEFRLAAGPFDLVFGELDEFAYMAGVWFLEVRIHEHGNEGRRKAQGNAEIRTVLHQAVKETDERNVCLGNCLEEPVLFEKLLMFRVAHKGQVAVQDQGLVINPKTCKSQIYGAVIMGIAAALFERRITDPQTGAFVNAELGEYQLARLGDIGELVVELYEPESERVRGVIGNGEPPAISPKAAISNAVANALGVRVPVIPMTPKRVLEALAKA